MSLDLFKTNGSSPPPWYDAHVEDHGSLMLLRPASAAARTWLAHHVQADVMWWGDALVVEPRYISDLVIGMAREGFCVAGGRAR